MAELRLILRQYPLLQKLYDEGGIDEPGIRRVLERMRETGGSVEQALAGLGLDGPSRPGGEAGSGQGEVADVLRMEIDPVAVRFVPQHICRRHVLIPVRRRGRRLEVVMADPNNVMAVDDIQLLTGLMVVVRRGEAAAIQRALDLHLNRPTTPPEGFSDGSARPAAPARVAGGFDADLAREVELDAVRLVPPNIARRHLLIAVRREGNRLTVVMARPEDLVAIDDLRLLTGLQVQPVPGEAEAIGRALDRYYPEDPSYRLLGDF
ncbi:MAG: hypothetical protein GX442_06615 [Candidatus Riflebacteria bacterium]|nr:hypothetical protein [Candidatus Riflebacteria bacterium]